MPGGEREQRKTLKFLTRFYWSSNRAYSMVSSSRFRAWFETLFGSHPKWEPQLSADFTSLCLVSNWLSLSRRILSLINSFSVFYPASSFNGFPFSLTPSVNQKLFPICCVYASIFNPGSLTILQLDLGSDLSLLQYRQQKKLVIPFFLTARSWFWCQ